MAPPSSFQKARLEIEGGASIACLFNPTEYSVSKSNTWDAKPTPGAAAAAPQFGGGAPRELSLGLLFDATLLGDGAAVREATEALLAVMEPSQGEGAGKGGKKNTSRPPMLTFVWGRSISFQAFARQLTVQYKLFAPDGEPLRADVKLTLLQADASPPKGQNPTTRADGSLGEHVVAEGDTLASIAYAAYGDPTRWRAIAHANGIDDPMRLRRGMSLAVPRLET